MFKVYNISKTLSTVVASSPVRMLHVELCIRRRFFFDKKYMTINKFQDKSTRKDNFVSSLVNVLRKHQP